RALHRSCAARARAVSPPHWACATDTEVSGAALLRGVVIRSCTYCTISFGSTRTVKYGCMSLLIGALPRKILIVSHLYGVHSTEFQGTTQCSGLRSVMSGAVSFTP